MEPGATSTIWCASSRPPAERGASALAAGEATVVSRRSARPWLFAAFAAWLLALAHWLSSAGVDFGDALASLAGSGTLLAVLLVAATRARSASPRNAALACAVVLLLAQGAVVALFIGAQAPGNPLFRARFALSAAALARAADMTAESGTARWIGLFRIERIEAAEGETRLFTGACGVIDRCGLARRHAAPPARGKHRYRRIAGDWYLLYDVF